MRRGRWASRDENETRVINALLLLRVDPDAGLAVLEALCAEASRFDRADAELLRWIVEEHQHLAS